MIGYQLMGVRKRKTFVSGLSQYWLLLFLAAVIVYFELIYRLWIFKGISSSFIFPVLFALPAAALLFLISGLFPERIGSIIAFSLSVLLFLAYVVQLIYYSIFKTPLAFYSLTGADDAMQFKDIIVSAILRNIIAVILMLIPVVLLPFLIRRFSFYRLELKPACVALVLCVASYIVSLICVRLTGDGAVSQYSLYYKTASPELSVNKLGLLTTMRLDIKRLVFGFEQDDGAVVIADDESDSKDSSKGKGKTVLAAPGSTAPETSAPVVEYNTMNIDFNTLISKEKDENLLDMHKYFSSVQPTKKNKYTGMFKGCNLILITAESFTSYIVDKERTPTLYKMVNEGFVFKNFYNPVWGVSTSDGEYVADLGIIPKPGVWSFAKSANNYLAFAMGNQFRKLGYPTFAYHNHSYTYYKRNLSHPNMGYDFKAYGHGLVVKKTWPESDLEMINVTAPEFIGKSPFHVYYMTVSGHMNYTFRGNYMAYKNKQLVANLPYSEPCRAYIACNMELEFAMKELMNKLEAAGIADKTVICISGDHYPYGLPRECIDEIAGHKVEDNFELYKSDLILYKKGMKPVVINEPCSSLDRIPTLSNLFGLEYDSRLMMGKDILSDSEPLVIFSNRSWITDKAWYNTVTDEVTYTKGNEALKDTDYVKNMNRDIANKFRYSAKILETDYYRKVVPKTANSSPKAANSSPKTTERTAAN